MRLYTEKNPKFSDSIKITDTTDPGNANLINEAAKQLIQNDLVIKKRIEQCLGEDPEHGNSQDMVVTFDSGDNTSAGEWTNVAAIQNGETHKSLFGKISTMFKNVRYLYKLLGTTDISSIGDGTVTNAIKKLKEDQPGAATQSVAGLLSADDKKKLDEIATKANNYTHPTTHAASMITQDTTHRFVSDTEKNAWDNKLNKTDVTRSTAVTVEGQKALDAVEKNAAVPGTMAYDLAQINSNLSNKIDKSSTSELIVSKNFSWTEEFQALSIDRGVIPINGYLHLIFQIGDERYSVFFDTIRGIVQPFFLGQNDTYNFYIGIRIDSDTQLSLCVKDIKGYGLNGGFANKPIWLRTYYTS